MVSEAKALGFAVRPEVPPQTLSVASEGSDVDKGEVVAAAAGVEADAIAEVFVLVAAEKDADAVTAVVVDAVVDRRSFRAPPQLEKPEKAAPCKKRGWAWDLDSVPASSST